MIDDNIMMGELSVDASNDNVTITMMRSNYENLNRGGFPNTSSIAKYPSRIHNNASAAVDTFSLNRELSTASSSLYHVDNNYECSTTKNSFSANSNYFCQHNNDNTVSSSSVYNDGSECHHDGAYEYNGQLKQLPGVPNINYHNKHVAYHRNK